MKETKHIAPIRLDPILSRLRTEYGVMLPRPHDTWRSIADAPLGQVNGLERFRGKAVATNGVIAAILTSANNVIFGHIQWFVCDEPDEQSTLSNSPTQQTPKQTLKGYDEFF